MKDNELIAHVKYDERNRSWIVHSLEDHLKGTAELAKKFAETIGLEKIAYISGLIHDAGKASDRKI